jgi:hypothetical protein
MRTHAKLVQLSEASGSSLVETVREAAEALHRQRFAHQVAEELSVLREDPSAWSDYLAEADSTAVTDGVRR